MRLISFVDLRVLSGSRFGFLFYFFPNIVMDDLDRIEKSRYTGYVSSVAIHRLSAQEVSHAVITAAMKVHSELGAGLLESAYQACLHHELHQAGIRSACQVGLPVVYRGVRLEIGYRMDLLVEDLVIVEIKSVDAISPIHQAQIISYLNSVAVLSDCSSTSMWST